VSVPRPAGRAAVPVPVAARRTVPVRTAGALATGVLATGALTAGVLAAGVLAAGVPTAGVPAAGALAAGVPTAGVPAAAGAAVGVPADVRPSDPAVLLALPPAAAAGTGAVARVDGVRAAVDGAVATVVPRTASADGALEQEGEADFVLAADVYFDFGSAVLLPRAVEDLARVAGQVREAGVTRLLVVGHTDSISSAESNQVLSEQRAAAVVAVLQPQLPGVTLSAEGRGETEPVAVETTDDGQDDPAGRALNRRVTITPTG